jgi:hypothetical protein
VNRVYTCMLPRRFGKIGRADGSVSMRPVAVVVAALAAVALVSACTPSSHREASHSQTASSSPVGNSATNAPNNALTPGSSGGVANSAAPSDVVSTTTPAPSGASIPSPKPTTAVGGVATHTPVPKPTPSATTPSRGIVPAPSGGNVSQLVTPTATPTTAAPVALQAPAKLNSVVVSLVTIQAITVGVSGPGEVAGPALAVTVNISNNSSAAVDVSSAVVTLLDSQGQVGTPTPASPASPFTGSVQPGASANGVYVFGIAKTQRNPINVYVSYTAGAATAHFFGNAS